MLKIPVFAASYYCPFALIQGPTRVSVRVCNVAVDPRVLRVLQVKWYQSPTLYRSIPAVQKLVQDLPNSNPEKQHPKGDQINWQVLAYIHISN